MQGFFAVDWAARERERGSVFVSVIRRYLSLIDCFLVYR